MNTLLALVALLGLLGQESPEVAPASAPEVVRMRAIHGYEAGRGTIESDPELAPLADYLAGLGYDTFRNLGFHEVTAPFGQETPIPVDDRYTVHIRPVNVSESGEVLFDARVEWSEGGRTVQALKVAGRAPRGQGLVLRGLAMSAGELIVILSIAKPDEEGGGGGGTGDQPDGGQSENGGAQQDPADDGGGPQNQNVPMEEQEPTPEEPLPELKPRESEPTPPPVAEPNEESPLPPDLANMEAILRALEEQDMREQKNARNRRYDVIVRGDWW